MLWKVVAKLSCSSALHCKINGKVLPCIGVAQMWLGFELLAVGSTLRAIWIAWLVVVGLLGVGGCVYTLADLVPK